MNIRYGIDEFLSRFEKNYVTYNRIEVSKSALTYNLNYFIGRLNKPVIPVLKANAYGHGIGLVARALSGSGCPYLAVDGYFEALRIRRVCKTPVLIMGAIAPENYANMHLDNYAFVVDEAETIDALGHTGRPVKLHLEINSGMNRRGVKQDQAGELTRRILSYKNLELEGVMSHLADSDGDNPNTVNRAVSIFDSCVEEIKAAGANPSIIHLAQTAGSLKAKSKYANAVRIGIGLYGLNPFSSTHKLHKDLQSLKPALKLISTVSKVIDLNTGDRVSYNYTFTADKPLRIGILPLGYYEGVNRSLSNKGQVKIGDKFMPIVGKICMNHTIIALGDSNTKVGDEAVVISDNPRDLNSLDSISSTFNLFNYNLLTALSQDVRRLLVE